MFLVVVVLFLVVVGVVVVVVGHWGGFVGMRVVRGGSRLRLDCGLRSYFRLKLRYGLKLGCDYGSGLWVAMLTQVLGVVAVGYGWWLVAITHIIFLFFVFLLVVVVSGLLCFFYRWVW